MPKTGGGLTFVDPKLTKPGRVNGHKTGGGLVYVNPHNSQSSKNKGKKKEKKKIDAIRGKEITIRDSAAPAQVIYGIMRVGGITTMIHTSSLSSAYLQTGDQSSNNALLWSAVTPGDAGNDLTVELFNPGPSNPTTTCSLTGGVHVKITLATNGAGAITSTLNQVISALQSHGPSSALMKCQKSFAGTNGVVTALAQTSLQYGGGEYLHQIITLAGHKIDSVMKLYLDGREVQFGASPDTRWSTGYFTDSGGSLVFMAVNYGDDDQIAQPDCVAQIPSIWTENHRQRGCAHVYLLMRYSQSIFAEGLPEIEFLVKGKPVYDPRTGQTAFTDSFGSVIGQNAALIANDYLTNTRFGCGCTTVDQATLIAAANICDENVARVALPDEKRYALNSSFDPTQGPDSIIEELEMGMAGKIFSYDGKIFIHPGAWRAPTVTFTVDDLRGDVIINQTHVPRTERFNYARGTYVSDVDFQETDIPPQKNDSYATEDGGVIYEDFPINFVTSPTQCQRILKIELEKVRQGIQVSVPLKLSGLLVGVGDTVNLSLPRYGWTPKIFEVMNCQIVVEDDGVVGVDLELRETASAIYDWNSGMETAGDTAPNTTLPSATDVGEPTSVIAESGTSHLYIRSDGTVQSRVKVSWVPPNSYFVTSGGKYRIRHKKSSDTDWIATSEEPDTATFHYILDVKDGDTYNIEVQAVNTIGYASDWVVVTPHVVIGKTAPPSDVNSGTFAASLTSFGINLNWEDITDLDRSEYEIREGASWAAGSYVFRGKGTTFRWENKVAGAYTFWIKAYDTSGNQSVNAVSTLLTITAPTTPTVSAEINGPNLKLTWTASTGSFAIKEYEIRYGASYAAGTAIGIATTNNHTLRVDWGGARTFWVAARDISNNTGVAGSVVVTINNPNPAQGFNVTTVDNNILLDWKDPIVSTLPIAEYKVYKGDVFATSILLGTVYGTFHTYIERLGGQFTYHIESIDTAGNVSTSVNFTATVFPPDDFFIRSELELVNSGDVSIIDENLLNAVRLASEESLTIDEILFPISGSGAGMSLPWLFGSIPGSGAEETWDQWWDNNSWTTWQDAIDAGFDANYPTPTNTHPGYIEWVVDYSVTFASSFIDFFKDIEVLGTGLTITSTISISLDNITYVDYVGAEQLFAENFRYVKYRLDFVGLDNKSLARLKSATVRVSLAVEEETQVVEVDSADSGTGGTVVTFQKDYLDVQDIQATPVGTSFASTVVNFVDIQDPVLCKILLYDSDGTPISGDVNVRIRGAVNP